MSRTYQTDGIILKTMAMGEADRLLTIMSPDHGLIRAIAPGARKPRSKLGGRTALFVVNQMMLLTGRSLDKLLQATVKESFPGLSRDLAKLTTAQYWAELCLCQSMSQTPEAHLYPFMLHSLKHLETSPQEEVLFLLLAGVSQLLYHAGIMPQLNVCVRSQRLIEPILFGTGQGIYFSYDDGGIILGDTLDLSHSSEKQRSAETKTHYTGNDKGENSRTSQHNWRSSILRHRLTLSQWVILNAISPERNFTPSQNPKDLGTQQWLSVEKILRGYAQHHFERSIRSATLVESVFTQ